MWPCDAAKDRGSGMMVGRRKGEGLKARHRIIPLPILALNNIISRARKPGTHTLLFSSSSIGLVAIASFD